MCEMYACKEIVPEGDIQSVLRLSCLNYFARPQIHACGLKTEQTFRKTVRDGISSSPDSLKIPILYRGAVIEVRVDEVSYSAGLQVFEGCTVRFFSLFPCRTIIL